MIESVMSQPIRAATATSACKGTKPVAVFSGVWGWQQQQTSMMMVMIVAIPNKETVNQSSAADDVCAADAEAYDSNCCA
jgi:hypothetical protein